MATLCVSRVPCLRVACHPAGRAPATISTADAGQRRTTWSPPRDANRPAVHTVAPPPHASPPAAPNSAPASAATSTQICITPAMSVRRHRARTGLPSAPSVVRSLGRRSIWRRWRKRLHRPGGRLTRGSGLCGRCGRSRGTLQNDAAPLVGVIRARGRRAIIYRLLRGWCTRRR